MKNSFLKILIVGILFLIPTLSFAADPASEVHITPDGKVSLKKVKVTQIAGTNFYTKANWETVSLRITVVTKPSTKISKKHGETSSVYDIKEGDILDIDGFFPVSSESFLINASNIVNSSLEQESLTVTGTITAINIDGSGFGMKTSRGTLITVMTGGASVIKGIIRTPTSQLKVGDKVTEAIGTYDFPTKTLTADSVKVYQDRTAFIPHNFRGKIKSISGTTLPLQIVVGLTTKDYTVNITSKTDLTNANGQKINIARFLVGDSVRFYGSVMESDLNQVENVEIFRDMDL